MFADSKPKSRVDKLGPGGHAHMNAKKKRRYDPNLEMSF